MAKNNTTIFSLAGVDPTVEITKHLNKKGKLSNCSKKEKKVLKSVCEHQIINKKGKIKVRIQDANMRKGQQMLRCPICGDVFKAGFYTDEELAKGTAEMQEMVSQSRMIGAAIGVDKRTRQQLGETSLYINNFTPTYKSMRKVAQKQDKIKNKNKNKKNKNKRLGGWDIK